MYTGRNKLKAVSMHVECMLLFYILLRHLAKTQLSYPEKTSGLLEQVSSHQPNTQILSCVGVTAWGPMRRLTYQAIVQCPTFRLPLLVENFFNDVITKQLWQAQCGERFSTVKRKEELKKVVQKEVWERKRTSSRRERGPDVRKCTRTHLHALDIAFTKTIEILHSLKTHTHSRPKCKT